MFKEEGLENICNLYFVKLYAIVLKTNVVYYTYIDKKEILAVTYAEIKYGKANENYTTVSHTNSS